MEKTGMIKKYKIFFVCYGGGHARMLAPVIERISKWKKTEVIVLALTTAVLEFDNDSITILGYKNFFNQNPKVNAYGEELVKSLEKVIDKEETIAYLGANYLELVDTLGEAEAHKRFDSLGRQAFEPIKTMSYIVEEIAPDLVVATNSPRSEKAAIQAAHQLKIPAIAIIDMFAIRCEEWFSKPTFADKVLVLSDSVKQYLIQKGRDAHSIIITGNPAFDSLVQRFNNNKDVIRSKRDNLSFTVLWASQREPKYCLETNLHGDTSLPIKIEKKLINIFSKHESWQLIARNHPSEVQREYPSFVKISPQSENLLDLLSSVHLVITLTSTVGFQGAILGAKFITIDQSVFTPTMPFSEMKFSKGIGNLEEVEPALLEFSKKISDQTLRVYEIPNATERVLKEIKLSLGIL